LGALEQDLVHHAVIGLDTAPFIYLWERHPRYFALCVSLFQYLNSEQATGVTSIITLIEACVHPHRQGRTDLVEAYERWLLRSRQVRVLPLDTAAARRALALRSEHNIPVPDALQIAAALEMSATSFVTNDQRLRKVKDIVVLVLEDYTQ
jgi:predicted nucleic acid-binding protein